MRGDKSRTQNDHALERMLSEHVIQNIETRNVLVQEYNINTKQKPPSLWMKDITIPRWLLTVVANLGILAFIGFTIFAAVSNNAKGIDGQSCRNISNCRQDLGLICDNGRCSCQYSFYWDSNSWTCKRQRTNNELCTSDSMCDTVAELSCQAVVLSDWLTVNRCQCRTGISWNGFKCGASLYNASCQQTSHCDTQRFLICDLSVGSPPGQCRCNSSMFWSGNANTGICEYKHTINQYCYPYRNEWCDDTGPLAQGLICAAYSSPYGSYYGVCQCDMHSFHNGTRCVSHRTFNQPCTSTSDCDYRFNFTCLFGLCTCPSGYGFNTTASVNGVVGACQPAGSFLNNCTNSAECDASQRLMCDLSYYGGANQTGACVCNGSWSYWDGTRCVSQLSIGGRCSSNSECLSSRGLVCSSYTNSLGTCDCLNTHYWNETCLVKLKYNASCTSQYVCDGSRGLFCQNLGNSMFQRCDCMNYTQRWDSVYVSGGSEMCVPKLSHGASCLGDSECRDYKFLQCRNGTCLCSDMDFWDGSSCQPKRSYAYLCSQTSECQNYNPVNLTCQWNYVFFQCLCGAGQVWDECNQTCVFEKQRLETCSLTSNCSSVRCDQTLRMSCLSTTLSNITGLGICDCNSNQVWMGICIDVTTTTTTTTTTPCSSNCTCNPGEYFNGTRCVPKRDYLDPCNYTFNCRDYSPVNLVCRTGSSGYQQCLCNSTSYFESCTQRCVISKKYLQSCMLSSSNCSSTECDQNANLQCINDSVINTGNNTGWCNCTSLQWWNGSYCREKGKPSWGVNASDICNSTYQCADYNLVSCPLGGSSLVRNASCECATTKYWNGLTCLDRVFVGQSCTLWQNPPVSTSTCLSAAGAGLVCTGGTCVSGTCTGGMCVCPSGSTWNATFSICYTPQIG